MSLAALPNPPREGQFCAIEGHSGLDKRGSVTLTLRIVGTDQIIKMRSSDLLTSQWYDRLSRQDQQEAARIDTRARIGNSKEFSAAKRVVNLFSYPWGLRLSCAYIALLLVSNFLGGKLTSAFGFEFPAVMYFFPITFIIGDIVTEVYGYSVSRSVIQAGFAVNLFCIFAVGFVLWLPSGSHWNYQAEFEALFAQSTRITAASLCAYLGGEFLNAYLLSRAKVLMNGMFLKVRVLFASGVADLVDSIIFCTLAFTFILPTDRILLMIFVQFLIKFGLEVATIFLTEKLCSHIKVTERVDVYDSDISYSPFLVTAHSLIKGEK